MKTRGLLLIICLILCSGLLLVACTSNNTSSSNVSLDFLITPDQIRMYSDSQLLELQEIEDRVRSMVKWRDEKYDDLSKMTEEDIKTQEEINKTAIDAINSGKIITNKNTIENIFNKLRGLEGIYVDSFEELKEDVIVRMGSTDDKGIALSGSLDNPYLGIFMLL